MKHKLWFAFLALALLAFTHSQPAAGQEGDASAGAITVLDVPASWCGTGSYPSNCYLTPTGINSQGTVVGYYGDSNLNTHGFYRTADGVFTGFNGPSGCSTTHHNQTCASPQAINDSGTIVGQYYDGKRFLGFTLDASGSFTTITLPDATQSGVMAVNSAGAITGYSIDSSGAEMAFVRDASGNLSTFDAPRIPGQHTKDARPTSINSLGEIVGTYLGPYTQGFLRGPGGFFTLLDIPGSFQVFPAAVDDAGRVYGYSTTTVGTGEGFIRDQDGSYTFFGFPGTNGNVLAADQDGTATGLYISTGQGARGFYRLKDGTFGSFRPPNSKYCASVAISSSGDITGSYVDLNGTSHGFLRAGH